MQEVIIYQKNEQRRDQRVGTTPTGDSDQGTNLKGDLLKKKKKNK